MVEGKIGMVEDGEGQDGWWGIGLMVKVRKDGGGQDGWMVEDRMDGGGQDG